MTTRHHLLPPAKTIILLRKVLHIAILSLVLKLIAQIMRVKTNYQLAHRMEIVRMIIEKIFKIVRTGPVTTSTCVPKATDMRLQMRGATAVQNMSSSLLYDPVIFQPSAGAGAALPWYPLRPLQPPPESQCKLPVERTVLLSVVAALTSQG